MKKTAILFMFSLFLSQIGLAHGDHGAGEAKPQLGGILRSLETIHLELVHLGQEIRIYIYSKDEKPKALKAKNYPVSAKAVLPRDKGTQKIELEDKGDHWTATYDPKGVHRYDFILNIKQGGHEDDVKFTIEPNK